MRDLLFDLGLLVSGPTVMYCDSQSAVGMALDPIAFKKTKHILRAAEFLNLDMRPFEVSVCGPFLGPRPSNFHEILTCSVLQDPNH